MVLGGVPDLLDRELLLVDFRPIKESRIGELAAHFDIVLGVTPPDAPGTAQRPRSRG
jgi:protocatechuate 3,4-dioxygenase beta subunit